MNYYGRELSRERYRSSHDRTIIRRMRTNLIPGQCAR